jgi:uncharacterized protein YdeI (YjbR/CyaY-like superfamily)
MTPAGLRAIEQAKQGGAWNALDKVDIVVMMPELKTALARNKKAREQFKQTSMTQKKQFLWWIESAKLEETKLKRVVKAVELLEDKKSMSDYFYGRQTSAARGRCSVSS